MKKLLVEFQSAVRISLSNLNYDLRAQIELLLYPAFP